jgi:hypothetical protein
MKFNAIVLSILSARPSSSCVIMQAKQQSRGRAFDPCSSIRRLPAETLTYRFGHPLEHAIMNHEKISLSLVTYLFLVLSIVLTLLRCYTRFYLLKSHGLDDVLSICSLVRFEIPTRGLSRMYLLLPLVFSHSLCCDRPQGY